MGEGRSLQVGQCATNVFLVGWVVIERETLRVLIVQGALVGKERGKMS